jgi:hypothetical protein
VKEVKQDLEAETGGGEEVGEEVMDGSLISSSQNQSLLRDWHPKEVSEYFQQFHFKNQLVNLNP